MLQWNRKRAKHLAVAEKWHKMLPLAVIVMFL